MSSVSRLPNVDIYFKFVCTFTCLLIFSLFAGVMVKHWQCLTASVGAKFNVLLLCRILHLLAGNNNHLDNARTLATELLNDPYQLSLDDYLNMVEIFGQERLFEECVVVTEICHANFRLIVCVGVCLCVGMCDCVCVCVRCVLWVCVVCVCVVLMLLFCFLG